MLRGRLGLGFSFGLWCGGRFGISWDLRRLEMSKEARNHPFSDF